MQGLIRAVGAVLICGGMVFLFVIQLGRVACG